LEAIAGRAGLIECLDEGVTDKREIEERLNKSRSTINRWLSDLREADVITSEAEGHKLTVVGRLAYEEYVQFEERFSDIHNAKPLLVYLAPEVDFDVRILEGAEILLSDEIAPQEPILRLEDMVQKAQTRTIHGVSPVVLPRYVDFFHDQIVAEGLEAEFVLETDVMEYLLSAYHDEVTAVMETDRGTFTRVEGQGLPYGLAVVDDEGVWVGIYESGGGLRGAIINKSLDAIQWGHEKYDSVRQRAEVVDSSDVMLRGASC
jgi:predicted transcriptional regulator